jgi:hypothetical protein
MLSLLPLLLAVMPAAATPAPSDDQFKNCGAGEAGIEVLESETNSPFPAPWCCGNTTWSAFKWRARASPNFPYDGATSAPPSGPGLSNATTCSGKHARVSQDCFSFSFNMSTAGKNYTTANQWTSWSEFDPNAKTVWSRATNTTSKVGPYYCTRAPNSGVDPIRHLELDLYVYGVSAALNCSVITLEIQPHNLSQPPYLLNVTAAHMAGVHGGLPSATQSLPVAFFLSRANLTNASSRPLVTELEHWQPLLQALPQNSRSPKTIRINTGLNGMNNIDFWRASVSALVGSGYSGFNAVASPVMAKVFSESGAAAGRPSGMINPPPNVSKQCGAWMGSGPVDHCWGKTEEDVSAMVKLYAEGRVAPMRAAGFSTLSGLSLWDELGWSYPGIWAGRSTNNISGNPRVFAKYQNYIKERSGFTTPQEFGAESWSEVVPITKVNVTKGGPHEEGLWARVYWSVRFAAWDVVTWFGRVTAALVEANGGTEFGIYTNCNNFHGRLFTPGGISVQAGTGVQISKADRGGMDWGEAGRARAGTALWTEDWFGEDMTSQWSYMATRMRCAAKLGNITFGGYLGETLLCCDSLSLSLSLSLSVSPPLILHLCFCTNKACR